ncbi:IclR family transcriptional regulator C-terminal domain-containing protein [Bradyrhizobium sp. NP1]|uniref:IclR family transcriptional regulator n=1 Tax=Bradyrhizobium sp. NP1 TaxID=3049772 RepID=UPI0025A581F6|nr:IclR family transcriptional regulator C-terminal domain-containing protein [Bradyrhizobium sp. NP1]WJR80316.1 IclR family transcriptional regulator C-terminal domain-containing protein [Bradyrhizobium sp. NP1]
MFVASVEKAFRVLDVFKATKSELGLSEVAAKSGIGKSAAQRFLYTLQTLGYLTQNPASKTFRLSSKLFELSASYVPENLLREKAEPVLEEANRRCEETLNLTILDGTDVTYILRFPSKHVVSVNLTVGTRLPAFCTAPGRILLAHAEAGTVEAALDKSQLVRRTEHTEIDPAKLREILKQVRRQGYSFCNQEAFLGDISIAAPVVNSSGDVVAAVNVAVPYPRWSIAKAQRQLVPVIKDVAEGVSAALRS